MKVSLTTICNSYHMPVDELLERVDEVIPEDEVGK